MIYWNNKLISFNTTLRSTTAVPNVKLAQLFAEQMKQFRSKKTNPNRSPNHR